MIFPISAALLDACVLSVLEKGDAYGYILTQTMREVLDVSESSLYPVLRRLQKDGSLSAYDSPWQGRNRRYYKITGEGREKLAGFRTEWADYRDRVGRLIEGGETIAYV